MNETVSKRSNQTGIYTSTVITEGNTLITWQVSIEVCTVSMETTLNTCSYFLSFINSLLFRTSFCTFTFETSYIYAHNNRLTSETFDLPRNRCYRVESKVLVINSSWKAFQWTKLLSNISIYILGCIRSLIWKKKYFVKQTRFHIFNKWEKFSWAKFQFWQRNECNELQADEPFNRKCK